jgi:hypothetical protein
LASLRQRPSQAKVRSMTHRFGRISKPWLDRTAQKIYVVGNRKVSPIEELRPMGAEQVHATELI